jgi:hypothetical protein
VKSAAHLSRCITTISGQKKDLRGLLSSDKAGTAADGCRPRGPSGRVGRVLVQFEVTFHLHFGLGHRARMQPAGGRSRESSKPTAAAVVEILRSKHRSSRRSPSLGVGQYGRRVPSDQCVRRADQLTGPFVADHTVQFVSKKTKGVPRPVPTVMVKT